MVTSGRAPIIEVFADIWCPFAHVGLDAVREHRTQAGREDVAIRVRSWPLEWVNGRSMDAGATFEHVRHLREQVSPDLFANVASSPFPTSTLDALVLAAAAYDVSDERGEEVSFELRDAIFERGQDISDRLVLSDIARTCRIELPCFDDRSAVERDWREGQVRGVKGSPHFFFDNREVFCPALSITKDADYGMKIEWDLERMGEFLESCFQST